MAEEIVLAAMNHGVEVIILNPAEVIGRYDHNFQWGRLVMAVFADRVPFIPPGGASFCSASEVGKAHVTALTCGKSGERYILAGDDRNYSQFLELIEQQLAKKFSKPRTHYRRLYWKEKLKDKFYPLLGKEFMVEPYRLKVFGGHYYFSSKKAEQDLGYRPAKLGSMVSDCVNWYRTQGILPA
jgi:dihydroflavonol-4-reductase